MHKDEILNNISSIDNRFEDACNHLRKIVNAVDRTHFKTTDPKNSIFEKINDVIMAINNTNHAHNSRGIEDAILALQKTCRKYMGGNHYVAKKRAVIGTGAIAGIAATGGIIATIPLSGPAISSAVAITGTAVIAGPTCTGTTTAIAKACHWFFADPARENYKSIKKLIGPLYNSIEEACRIDNQPTSESPPAASRSL